MLRLAGCTKLNLFKERLVHGTICSSANEFLIFRRINNIHQRAAPFYKALRCADAQQYFIDAFKRHNGVITSGFSLHRNFSLTVQNGTFRKCSLVSWLQNNEVNIAPNISRADDRTHAFAFEVIEKEGTVALNPTVCYYFSKILVEMVKGLKPNTAINYKRTLEDVVRQYIQQGITGIQIKNYIKTVRAHSKEERLTKAGYVSQSCKRLVS